MMQVRTAKNREIYYRCVQFLIVSAFYLIQISYSTYKWLYILNLNMQSSNLHHSSPET